MNRFALLFTIAQLFGSFTMALNVQPIITPNGQALAISCNAKTESLCNEVCGNKNQCKVQESYCRSCAGTSDLRLKRILDSTGNTLFANKILTLTELGKFLKSGNWISLHPTTLYNYSGAFDSEQLRTQFRSLCTPRPQGWEIPGILLLSLSADHRVEKTIGALCPSLITGSFEYMNLLQKWQVK